MSATKFVLCINNEGHEVSLAVRKVYRVLPDPDTKGLGLVRVVDETDEDYLFPIEHFVPIKLPAAAEKAFSEVA